MNLIEKQTKPLLASIEADYDDDDDVKHSPTESSIPTQLSKSTTNDSTQQTGSVDGTGLDNNNKTGTTVSRNSSYENNMNHFQRQKTMFAKNSAINGKLRLAGSEEILSPLNINEEESPHELKSIVQTHIEQIDTMPKVRYSNKIPSSKVLTVPTGKTSSLKYSSSLNTRKYLK